MARRDMGENDPRAAFWAALTILALPVVALSLNAFGIYPVWSFFTGILAALFILLLEGAIRGRWWIMEPAIAEILGQPDLTYRLLVFVGIVLLLFETVLLTIFLTSPSLDRGIAALVIERQCVFPRDSFFARFCRSVTEPDVNAIDPIDMAIRAEAARRFFPDGGFVTCAAKKLAREKRPDICLDASVVRCDRWSISRIAKRPIQTGSLTATVMARLEISADGTYTIAAWSDTPAAPEWTGIGEDLAGLAYERRQALPSSLDDELRTETYRRALEALAGE